MTRRLIAIFTALLLTATLCACNDDKPPKDEETTGTKINIGTQDETDSQEQTEETSEEKTTETETDAPVVSTTFTEQKDTVYVISFANQVNLRSEPNMKETSAKMVVENGIELQRIAVSDDGWSKVIYDGSEYYIGSTYVTTLKDLDEGFTEVSKTLTLAGSLFVRISPTMDNEKIDTLAEGAVVTVVAENTNTGWYKITFDGLYAKEGYIVSDAKYFVADEETTAAADEATTEAASEADEH